MTDDVRGSGGPPAGAGDAPPVPGVSIAARAQPAVDQSFDGDSLYAVRATVAAHASAAGIQEGRVRNVVLAVHELAANAVRHGAGQGRMRLWVTGDGIRCEVTDAGERPLSSRRRRYETPARASGVSRRRRPPSIVPPPCPQIAF